MKFSLILLNVFFLIAFQTDGQVKKEKFVELTSKIDSIISEHKFNGVILLSTDSIQVYSKSIGFSDLENKIEIDVNDQFVIGSISKQITAVLLLREYEKGKIGLNDTIGNYLTEIRQTWVKDVTVHQLLIHTHGILDINKPLEFKQGSQFHYSQLGYELLAQILEKITSKPFEVLSTDLFEQFGLDNTFHPQNKRYKNLVKGYEENETGILQHCSNSLSNYVPAGSFISNVHDLNKWNQLLHSGQLVKKETLELMKTKYATRIHPIFETVDYGYGLLFKEGEQNIQIGALGYAPGFVSACYYFPSTNLNLVVLENTANNMDDFKKTFIVHTEILELISKLTTNNSAIKISE